VKTSAQYFIIVTSLLILCCERHEKRENRISDDEYKVMEAVINDHFISTHYKGDTVNILRLNNVTIEAKIINGNTTGFVTYLDKNKWNKDSLFTIKSYYPNDDWNYIDSSFKAANTESSKLDTSKFHFNAKCILVPYSNIYNAYQVIFLSRVGFNKDLDMALILFYANRSSHATGINALYKKVNDQWVFVNSVTYWDGGID
jgi:hypothetical protein